MISINAQDKQPIYQQIIDRFILLISKGALANGEQLPSIRELASQLGINPNTVARAYTELERRGVIITYPKKGAFVAEDQLQTEVERYAKDALRDWFETYSRLGISQDKLEQWVKEVSENASDQ